MTTPIEVLERLQKLPEPLRPHNRRFYVEAVSDDARAPMIEFYRQQDEASEAAQAWAKAHGAEGFYPPQQSWGRGPSAVRAFSFKRDSAPTGAAWSGAGRGYQTRAGYVAMSPSKRPAGKALAAEIEALPRFPSYSTAIDHLGLVTDLNTERGGGGVGHSGGSFHFTVPVEVAGRYFVSAVNHNFDIGAAAERAIEYLNSETPQYAPSLDYKGDPISWRPAEGWAFLSKSELDLIIAEENVRRAKLRAAA